MRSRKRDFGAGLGLVMMRASILLIGLGVAQIVAAQTQPPPATQPTFEQLPWPIQLGLRSAKVTEAFPLVDRVVLVPDTATYLDELGKWSPRGRWPVLIEDARFAPMFVRRFKPAQLIRREPVAAKELTAADLDRIVIHAFGGADAVPSIRAVFEAQKYPPPGVVITSLKDPAWTAAVALAAGHGQPIAMLDDSFGGPDEELNATTAQRLTDAVTELVLKQGYPWEKLGDAIDTITICRDMPVRATGLNSADTPVATTDLLGRNSDATRYAYAGWIFGDEIRSAYVAMCSLFLAREQAWMVNGYPSDGEWGTYATGKAAVELQTRGFTAQDFLGPSANEASWLRLLMGGVSADMILVNSKGNTDFFDLTEGKGHPYDAPILNTPAIVQFIHSWAMNKPGDASCVGGTWIDRGAYAAVGSVHEPFLSAFVPPGELANRCVNFVPFLIAARWWDGQHPLAKPWRVMTYGDPLMLCAPPVPPPNGVGKTRITQPIESGVDLTEQVKQFMRDTKTDESGESYAKALAILDMLGKDEIAEQLWTAADAAGKGGVAARAALPALFRMRDTKKFMQAWDQLRGRDAVCLDMLWHLMWPRAAGVRADKDLLLQMQSAIRQPIPIYDLRRLAPALRIAFDEGHAREVIEREAGRTQLPHVREELRRMAQDL